MPFLFPPTRVIAARYKSDDVRYNTLKSAVCGSFDLGHLVEHSVSKLSSRLNFNSLYLFLSTLMLCL